jgi:hypothetical protein
MQQFRNRILGDRQAGRRSLPKSARGGCTFKVRERNPGPLVVPPNHSPDALDLSYDAPGAAEMVPFRW